MKLTYAFIGLWFAVGASAQYIDVRSGFAIASGSFANTNINRSEDGFATSGNVFGIGAHYLVYKNLGIAAFYQFSSLGMNISSFAQQTARTAPPNVRYDVNTTEKYRSSSTLIGPYITFGKRNLTVDARLVMGYASLTLPKLIYTTTFNNNSYQTTTDNQKDGAFAVGYGFTVKYALPKDFILTLSIDNISANMRFNKNDIITSSAELVTKPLRSNSISLGFGYLIQ